MNAINRLIDQIIKEIMSFDFKALASRDFKTNYPAWSKMVAIKNLGVDLKVRIFHIVYDGGEFPYLPLHCTYNGQEYIGEEVIKLVDQLYDDWEVEADLIVASR